jgi:hypothetical protein
MRFFVAAFLLCGSCLSARAQFISNVGSSEVTATNASPIIVNDVKQVAYKIAYPPGYRMRNTGRTMTLIGVPLLIGGIILYNSADEKYYYTGTTANGTYEEGDPKAAGGILMVITGVGLTIPGVILWTKGAKKYNRHMERETAFKFNGTSLSLSYRF